MEAQEKSKKNNIIVAKFKPTYGLLTLAILCLFARVNAQEPASSEIYTEAYTDRFQELFFEALKEKGIENYDRARALLLQCKQLEEDNPVIDHELAKVMLLSGELAAAEAYAITALKAAPEEYWYLNTLMEILSREYRDFELIRAVIPSDSPKLKMNLASWYLDHGQIQKAETALNGLPGSPRTRLLKARLNQLSKAANTDKNAAATTEDKEAEIPEGSVEDYRLRLEIIEREQNWAKLLDLSTEAIELFPLQPYFYYQQGRAYLEQKDIDSSISSLLMGEELLIAPSDLNALIYQALSKAYSLKGNMEKATYYSNKLKEGL